MGPIRSLYPGTTAAEVLALTNGSAFKSIAATLRGDVVEALTAVRGIGPWSAQMHLIFSLGRPDVWPILDLGVRKGMARWYGLDPEPDLAGFEALGEQFRPWRTVAAWYAWRATEIPDALLPHARGA